MYCLDDGSIGYGTPDLKRSNTLIITTSKTIYNNYKAEGYEVVSLSAYLGISPRDKILTLYQVYDFFFSGNVTTKEQIVKILYSAFIAESKIWCYCLIVNDSVCWFRVTDKGIRKMGSMSVPDPISSISVGYFVKQLRYELVMTGVGLNKLSFLTYGTSILSDYYPVYKDLSIMFSGIDGIKDLSLLEVYNQLSNTVSVTRKTVSASDIVDALSDSYRALGLSFSNAHISYRCRYYKDYSDCHYTGLVSRNCEYFFIFDC